MNDGKKKKKFEILWSLSLYIQRNVMFVFHIYLKTKLYLLINHKKKFTNYVLHKFQVFFLFFFSIGIIASYLITVRHYYWIILTVLFIWSYHSFTFWTYFNPLSFSFKSNHQNKNITQKKKEFWSVIFFYDSWCVFFIRCLTILSLRIYTLTFFCSLSLWGWMSMIFLQRLLYFI